MGKVGTGRQWLAFRRERAAPLEAHPLGTIALVKHRLFRQGDDGTWDPVFEEIVKALRDACGDDD